MNGVREGKDEGEATVRRRSAHSVSVACVVLYLAVVVCLFLAIRSRDDGVFTYSIDDPYIHLALAQSLAHGHYGINPGEPSSPSSSILWPFLLVPFAARAWNLYAPLALNVLFCGIAAWLIGRTVDSWDSRWSARHAHSARLGWLRRFGVAVAVMLIANLVGLTFVGMEHGLQVLLAVACAAGLVEAFAGRPIPVWCIAAAVLGPLVRYESFALLAAVAVALCGQRRFRAAAVAVALSLAGPALFSVFLVLRGLPALPSSVLVKAMVFRFQGSFAFTAVATLAQSIYLGVREGAWWDQLAVAGLLFFFFRRERQRSRRFILGGALLTAVLQLLIGRFNWFHRYEVYAIVFTAIVAATALVESTRLRSRHLLGGLLALTWPYWLAIWQTPLSARNIYQQQYQMHRFLAGYRGSAVAVNDIGLVSYDRSAGLYVLDLWGLASPEASRRAKKDAAWLDVVTRAHSAGLVIFYPEWYPDGAPDDWQPLATMCMAGHEILGSRCVAFYSTPQGDHAALLAEVAAFARTLPAGMKVTLGKDTTDEDNSGPAVRR